MKFLRKKDYDNLCGAIKDLQEDKLVLERDCVQRTNIVGEHNTELVNHNMRLVADLANRDRQIELLNAELGPRREPISPEDRDFLRSRVPIEPYPGMAKIAPQECTWVSAFDLSACPVCDGIHQGGPFICPMAKSVEAHEIPETLPDGRKRINVRRVLSRDDPDDSGIVWRTDVFGTAPAATSDTQEEVVPTGS